MFMKMFKRWREDTSGVVAMVVVFCIPAFIAAAGVAVDLAQAYNIKTRLSAALDKAALAAGNTTGMTEAEIEQRVDAFINANYPEGALGDAFDVNVLLSPGTVDIHARSKVKTVFMGIVCPDMDPCQYMDVFAETIVKKEVSGLELVLVLDTTGSMNDPAGGTDTKISALKTAANSLLNILYGSASNVPKLYVGVVPFSQNTNVGTDYSSFTNSDSYDWGTGHSWMGCVEARYSGGKDITAETAASTKFDKYYYACDTSSNPWRFTTSANVQSNGDFSSGATGWTQQGTWAIASGAATKGSSGANVAVNGDFSSSGGWTLGNQYTIASGVLQKAAPPNIASNGTFGSSTSWSLGSNWTIGSGLLTKTNNTSSASATSTTTVNMISGYDYEVTYTVSNRTAGSVRFILAGTNGSLRSSNGTYTETLSATTNNTNAISFSTTNGFKGSIDNLSVKQLESDAYRTPTPALISGDQYEVIFTVSGYSAGGISATLGGTSGTVRSANGTYTQTIVAGSSGTVGFHTQNGFAGNIDNLTIRSLADGDLLSTPTLNSNTYYLVEYTITSITSGTLRAYLAGDTSCTADSVPMNCGAGTLRSTTGTFREVLSSNGTDTFRLASNNFQGTVDNVKIIPPCGASGPYTYAEPLNNRQGPNKYCSAAMLPMTPTKSEIVSKVNSLTAQGSTMIPLGIAWGWRMLDEDWRGEWEGTMAAADSPGPLPLDYNTSGMNKAVILMTDGDNSATSEYSAYDTDTNITYTSCSYGTTANSKLNCKTRDVCNAMKAKNILVYTIALGADLSTTSKAMLKDCATSPAYAFVSPTTSDLNSTFTTIANQLNSLYIVY